MQHRLSDSDLEFQRAFEDGRVTPEEFDHRAHVRLAYTYLAVHDEDTATERMSDALRGFLRHHGIGGAKYHATLTRAWILAARHFMDRAPATSADAFIEANPELLDSRIMLTHYSREVLFSPHARAAFVPPDLSEIPRRST